MGAQVDPHTPLVRPCLVPRWQVDKVQIDAVGNTTREQKALRVGTTHGDIGRTTRSLVCITQGVGDLSPVGEEQGGKV